jgi:prepilin-type N-terminal cleavage/methylation domain-containing protein
MKKAFTLIEIMISVIIFSLLFLVMVNLIKNLNQTKIVLKKEANKKDYLIKVLYNDILNAYKIKVIHSKYPNFDRLKIFTTNCFYNDICYVLWYVSKNKNALIRAENKSDFNQSDFYNSDFFKKNVKIFKIYRKNGKDFIFIKTDKPLFFEMVDKDLKVINENNGTKN